MVGNDETGYGLMSKLENLASEDCHSPGLRSLSCPSGRNSCAIVAREDRVRRRLGGANELVSAEELCPLPEP